MVLGGEYIFRHRRTQGEKLFQRRARRMKRLAIAPLNMPQPKGRGEVIDLVPYSNRRQSNNLPRIALGDIGHQIIGMQTLHDDNDGASFRAV